MRKKPRSSKRKKLFELRGPVLKLKRLLRKELRKIDSLIWLVPQKIKLLKKLALKKSANLSYLVLKKNVKTKIDLNRKDTKPKRTDLLLKRQESLLKKKELPKLKRTD